MAQSKAETFFNGTIKEVKLKAGGTGLLADKRIQLACTMPFGSIVGMPDWLSDEYVLVAKEGVRRRTSNEAKLEGVEISIYANDTQAEAILKVESCQMQGFKFARGKEKKNGAIGDVSLHFNISTLTFNKKLWTLIPDYADATLFMRFAGTQMSISFGTPVVVAPEDNAEIAKDDVKVSEKKSSDGKKLSPAAQKAADVMAGKKTSKGTELVH